MTLWYFRGFVINYPCFRTPNVSLHTFSNCRLYFLYYNEMIFLFFSFSTTAIRAPFGNLTETPSITSSKMLHKGGEKSMNHSSNLFPFSKQWNLMKDRNLQMLLLSINTNRVIISLEKVNLATIFSYCKMDQQLLQRLLMKAKNHSKLWNINQATSLVREPFSRVNQEQRMWWQHPIALWFRWTDTLWNACLAHLKIYLNATLKFMRSSLNPNELWDNCLKSLDRNVFKLFLP